MMASLKLHKKERPLVLGLDGHADDFLVATDPSLCVGARNYRTAFEDVNGNNVTDARICHMLDLNGFDCVFSSRLEPIEKLVRSGVCRALLFHPDRNDLSILEFLNSHPELMVVFLFSHFPALTSFDHIEGHQRLFQLDIRNVGVDVGDFEDILEDLKTDLMIGVAKTDGLMDLMTYLSENIGKESA